MRGGAAVVWRGHWPGNLRTPIGTWPARGQGQVQFFPLLTQVVLAARCSGETMRAKGHNEFPAVGGRRGIGAPPRRKFWLQHWQCNKLSLSSRAAILGSIWNGGPGGAAGRHGKLFVRAVGGGNLAARVFSSPALLRFSPSSCCGAPALTDSMHCK